ncbi:MAG: flagellar export chaperone FliS [Nitrospirota bacterium]|jgi:flagellar protein FliS
MLATQQIQSYRQNQVQHASPVELVVLLYDKAILLLKTAAAHLHDRRVREKCQALCQAVDIITELQAVLDKDRGGEIAAKLNALYTYMLERLTRANQENDDRLILEVVRLLEELQQGWRGLAQSSPSADRGLPVGRSQPVTA